MDYHEDFSSWSKTMCWLFRKSRVECRHTYITRQMSAKLVSPAAIEGIVKHSVALEGCAVDDLVITYPDDCLNVNDGLIGKKAAAFRADNPGAVIVKPRERDELLALATNVLQTAELQDFIGKDAIVEERFDALIEGVPCKCRPDFFREYDEYLDVFDLKFPKVFGKESFERSNKTFGYWFQREHYVAVLEKCFLKPVRNFTFLNIETKFPFRVLPKVFDPVSTIPAAKSEHRKTLRQLRECLDKDEWVDDWPSQVVMGPWDFQSADDLVEVE